MWVLMVEMIQEITALAVAGFVEGTGIPWPGSVIMAAAGMTDGHDWRAVALFVLTFATAYTAGALIQYAVGRLLGPLALGWLTKKQRASLERLMARYGFGAVCWSRPLAIGNYVSIPAGMVKMNPIRFSLYTFVGALPWAASTVLAGRLLGSHLPEMQAAIGRWMLWSNVLLLLLIVTWLLIRYRRRRANVKTSHGERHPATIV
ncbi:MAG: DedA family protein [Bacillota bacterium]